MDEIKYKGFSICECGTYFLIHNCLILSKTILCHSIEEAQEIIREYYEITNPKDFIKESEMVI